MSISGPSPEDVSVVVVELVVPVGEVDELLCVVVPGSVSEAPDASDGAS